MKLISRSQIHTSAWRRYAPKGVYAGRIAEMERRRGPERRYLDDFWSTNSNAVPPDYGTQGGILGTIKGKGNKGQRVGIHDPVAKSGKLRRTSGGDDLTANPISGLIDEDVHDHEEDFERDMDIVQKHFLVHHPKENDNVSISVNVSEKSYKVNAALYILTEWALNTTCHGMANIARSTSTFKRLFWGIVIFVMCSYSTLQLTEIYTRYHKYTVTTRTRFFQRSVANFPAITFCNNNPVRTSVLLKLFNTGDINDNNKLLSTTFPYTLGFTKNTDGFNSTARRRTFRRNLSYYWTTLSTGLRKSLGMQLEDSLLDCAFGGKPCTADNFTRFFNPAFGWCFTFNSALREGPPLRVSNIGVDFGLTMSLIVYQNFYIEEMVTAAGMRVLIHSRDTTPFMEDDSFIISPSDYTVIGISETSTNRLQAPYPSKCQDISVKERPLFDMYADSNFDYSLQGCQQTCYQRLVVDNCYCGDPQYKLQAEALRSDLDEIPACSGYELNDCEALIASRGTRTECACPSKCTEEAFKTSLSFVKWPGHKYKVIADETVNNWPPYKETMSTTTKTYNVTDQVVNVNIHFADLTKEVIAEVAEYTWREVMAHLGGSYGFLLGISLISVMEFLEMVVDLLWVQCGHILRESLAERRKMAGTGFW